MIKNNINNVNGKNNKLEEVIEFNFTKLKKEISDYLYNSKDDYKFRNPLIESNNIRMESLQRIVNECKIYSIGANYFIIYLLIKKEENNIEKIHYI